MNTYFSKVKMSDYVQTQIKELAGHLILNYGSGEEKFTSCKFWLGQYGHSISSSSVAIPIAHGFEAKEIVERDMKILRDAVGEDGLTILNIGQGICPVFDADQVVGILQLKSGVSDYPIYVTGSMEFITYFDELTKRLFDLTPVPQVRRLKVNSREVLISVPYKLKVPKIITNLGNFYPYLEKTPEEHWSEFKEADENIMLLIGDPGLGKSTFILSMLTARGWDKKIFLIDSTAVLEDKGLMSYLSDLPTESVVVIEDADTFVAPREGGNKQMSALLNLTSGIATSDTKFIISTNLSSVNKVDPALVRPGRCFDVLHFKPLENAQVNNARSVLGREPMDVVFNKKYSLAEALSSKPFVSKKVQVGFGSLA